MVATAWFLIIGVLLVAMAIGATKLRQWPVTTSMLYLGVGAMLGPEGFGLIRIDPVRSSGLIERLAEVAVLVSLFTAGLKLRISFSDRRWKLPLRLATVSMTVTVALIAAAAYYGLGLPIGAAVLIGAILAPTDPVLASEVQVEHATDRDRLRFALTGEAGLNDGTAFPFVLLGLGLLGGHELGPYWSRWLLVDVVWSVSAGVAAGWVTGTLVGRLVLYLRQQHQEAVGLDDLLALGLISLAYGLALLVGAYGFLAVFAAGISLRFMERNASGEDAPADVVFAATASEDAHIATAPETAPAYMAAAALGFTEQLERIGEVAIVLLIGGMLTRATFAVGDIWLVLLLFLVIRPAAVFIGAPMRGAPRLQRRLVAWFGIRGIGSVYYLMYAIQHGLPANLSGRVISITLTTIAMSAIVHGLSGSPLMSRYAKAMR